MNLKYLPLVVAFAIFCVRPFVLIAADTPGDVYHYTFELTEGRSCEGSSKLKPEEISRALAQASTAGGFLQLEQYRTASGTEATVGFVNPHYIVRFHLTPVTPASNAKH